MRAVCRSFSVASDDAVLCVCACRPFSDAGNAQMYDALGSSDASDYLHSRDEESDDRRTNIPLYKYAPPVAAEGGSNSNGNGGAGGGGGGGGIISPNNENYFDPRPRTGSGGPWGPSSGATGAGAGAGALAACDYGDDDEEEEEGVMFGDKLRQAREKGGKGKGKGSLLNKNFATAAAVRDFNASMPVVHVPSNFKPAPQGVSIRSDPRERL
jgi:hypothetical protein